MSRRRPRATARFVALAIAALAIPVAASVPSLTLTITEAIAQPQHPWGRFDAYPLKLYDFDGDGRKEILTFNDNNHVYVIHSGNGRILAELATTFPPGWEARSINGVEAERIHPSVKSLIVANSAATLTRFDFDPDASTDESFVFDKKWERRLDDFTANPGMDAKPTLVDANGNGIFEILAQVEEVGLFALRYDGTILWVREASGGNAEPVAADWDRDGHVEALFFSDDGWVRVYDSLTGVFEWSYDAKQEMGAPASIPRGGTVGDISNGNRLEVVFGARDAHDETNFANNHMGIFVVGNDDMNGQGNLVWMRQPEWAQPLWYTRFVIHDYNANGLREIYGMDWNTIGHNPGNWEPLGPAHVFAFNKYGGLFWMTELDTWWSNKDIAIADFDGDSRLEVMASGPDGAGHDGWWVMNISNGHKEFHVDVHPYKSTRAPRLADLDSDGDVDLVIPVEGDGEGTTPGEGALQVWDAGTPWSSVVWSGGEDAYPIRYPFWASAHPHPDSNEWYVKVKFRAFHHVVRAWFNENNGPWVPMTKLGSGPDWTLWDNNTENVPAGTAVRFKVQDDLGLTLIKGPYTWPP